MNEQQKMKYSVTVGIPVYNEEANIIYLLKSILNQKYTDFYIQEILVISDASTDKTVEYVNSLAKKHPEIKLIHHSDRQGKAERMSEIIKLSKGFITITLDGDVVLAKPDTIANITPYFHNNKVAVVSGNNVAVKSKTFVGKLINAWEQVWYEARKNANNGDNVYNVQGGVLAFRTDFVKSISIDKSILSTVKYIYFYAHFKKYEFRFARKATVLYRIPSTTFDFLLQKKRSGNEWEKMSNIFGKWIYDKFKIPIKNKIFAVMKMLILNPVYVSLAFIYITFVNYLPLREKSIVKPGLWKTVKSTKEGINEINFI